MALIIKYHAGGELHWYIGLKLEMKDIRMKDVAYVQADGDELELIKSRFNVVFVPEFAAVVFGKLQLKAYTIPMVNTSLMIWHGDIAKTIISNL